ncbi:MAG: CcmD family protein [Candidatus Cloacimonadota bacterium]|nr:MAG: CcmD family protein [Candidatus Cloacimonadota bacterium]
MLYLTIAYSIIWLGTIIYVLFLSASLKRIKNDLSSLRDNVEKKTLSHI